MQTTGLGDTVMIYGIVWLLSDVSLVQLHFLGAEAVTKGVVLALIASATLGWQVGLRKRDWRFESVLVGLIVGVAFWRVSTLPDIDLPRPEPGIWAGQWVGLPGQSSALFQPYASPSGKRSPLPREQACAGEPLPYRLWIRGIKKTHIQAGTVRPGLCVTLPLLLEPDTEELPSALESWRQRNRIIASMRLAKRAVIDINHSKVDVVDQWRLDLRHLFEQASSQEQSHRWSYLAKLPVLLGLVTGDRALMRPAHWRVFSDTGTSHLMSISGSHVGMFAVFVFMVVKWVVSWFTRLTTVLPAQHVALVAGWLGAFAYAMLAGFNVPTQRTLVMIAVAVVLKLRGRSILDWRAWWLALVAVTVYDPLAIFDRGAWLSFFAVALILWVLQGRLRPPGPIKGWVLVQWGIFIGLSPLLLYAFGGFPWISAVANAVAIPVTGFAVVPGAMLAALLLVIDLPGGEYLMALVLAVTDGLLWFLQQMADLGGAGYRVPQPGPDIRSVVLTLAALMGVLWWLAPRGIPGKWIAVALMLPILAGPAFQSSRLPQITWLPGAARQGFLFETEHSLWWVFEAGIPSRQRQPLLEEWLRNEGYGYRWDTQRERYADWIKNGFLVQRYDKFSPLPGQIHLSSPRLVAPCNDGHAIVLAHGWQLKPRQATENLCWLLVESPDSAVLLAGNLTRDAQLSQATREDVSAVNTLLVRPRSGQKLLGAVLNRYQPAEIVEWPGKTSLFPDATPKIEARGILLRDFSVFQRQQRLN